jgi:hypothetical protein
VDGLGRSFGKQAMLRGLLLIAAAALIWIGIGFAGYAIYLALATKLQPDWAAALTAALLLAAPLCTLIVLVWRRPQPALHVPDLRPVQADTETATLALLADVARQKPLLAVFIAGVLGAAETLRRRQL